MHLDVNVNNVSSKNGESERGLRSFAFKFALETIRSAIGIVKDKWSFDIHLPLSMVFFKIEWMTPKAPSEQRAYMLDTMSFRMSLLVNKEAGEFIDHGDFQCHLWTNLYHKGYNEGNWHSVTMQHQGVATHKDNNKVIYIYGVELLLTCLGTYGFTFRAKHRMDNEDSTVWGSPYKVNGQVTVCQPVQQHTTWVQEPELNQITSNVYLGNYQAALQAPDLGFDCLLNTADDAPVFPLQLLQPLIYRRCPLKAGANNPIPERVICQTVNWLRAMSDRCEKILIHSRAGYGRAGSIMVAFIFAYNRNLSFEESMAFVEKRHFVYNHQGLKDTLYKLYPRD